MTQQEALRILKTGANVFLTGEPGSGKTHTVNQYVDYLRGRGIEPAITASTGIAATHIGGVTIHSWSGIGIKTKLDKRDLGQIILNEHIEKRVRRAKVLIIDEVSMLASGTLSMVDVVCRKIKQNAEPFGGMQIVLVGDFFQLPPVVKFGAGGNGQGTLIDEPSVRFAYDSPSWARAKPAVCYLTEQHRQDDGSFLSILSSIRRNVFRENHLRCLASRKIEPNKSPEGVPKLFSLNADVDSINNKMLGKIFGKPQVFEMSSQGPRAQVAALQKGCLSPEMLYLKIGAAVMFTKNNSKDGFVNGTLGKISGFDKENGRPIVTTRDGRRIKVSPMDWTVEENGKIRARITQLPLRLAWAITVHKSQGMSLDEAVMDLSDVFEFGQGYVALSRVRKLSGIYLLGWNERAFQVHPEILVKDEFFRGASKEVEAEFTKKQDNFVDVGRGKSLSGCPTPDEPSSGLGGEIGGGISFEKIREKYPSAYRPWDEAQDEKLRKFFAQGLSVAELAEMFDRKKGAIRSRLAKLGLGKN